MPEETALLSEDPRVALGELSRASGGVEAPGTGPMPKGPQRDAATGKFAPKKSDDEVRAILEAEFPEDFKAHSPMGKTPVVQPEAGDLPAEGAKEGQSEKVEAVKPNREFVKAIDFLKRDKVPESVLSKLTPDEAVAYAKERKGLVVQYQQAQQRIAELEKAKPTIPAESEQDRGVANHSDVPALGSIADAVKGIRDLYGEEAAAPLEKAFGSVQKRLDAIEQTFTRATQAQTQSRVNEAREALQERFPQLEEEDGLHELVRVAAALEQAGIGTSSTTAGVKALFEKAARNLDWTPLEASEPNTEDDGLALLRANGTVSSKTKPGQRKPLSKDEKAEMAARFALDPKVSIEEARRRLAEM